MPDVDVRVSIDLDPETIVGVIADYDEDTYSYVAPAKAAFTEAYNALTAIHDAKAAAATDPTLNEYGALLKTDDYANRRMESVYPLWDTASTVLNNKVDAWEKEMTKAVESKASQMISGEIRAHFKSLPTGERMTAISTAIRNGDELVASAVLGGPGMLSGISEDMRAVLIREFHEQFNPEMAKRLRAVTAARDMINERLPLLRKELKKAVGVISVYQESNSGNRPVLTKTITPDEVRAQRDASNKLFAVTGL